MTMNLNLTPTTLQIKLAGFEQLWAFYFSQMIEISLDHLTHVSTEIPETSWKELRAPGTFLPGVIKAGTYYTQRGREFWYVTKPEDCLTLDLAHEYFKRIVINVNDSAGWAARLRSQ
jgi:hypothetical protein